MQPSYVPIDPELLRRLYVEEGLTAKQIATRIGCGATTIFRRIGRFGIAARPRGPAPGHRSATRPIEWSADMSYAVGLIATDGNLSRKPGRISIMSNDVDLLEMLRARLSLTAPITPHRGGYGSRCYRLVWSDRAFYDWLVATGLTPAKSLTLGPLAIPEEYFAHFVRGCIDGDGSIVTYVDHYNAFKKPSYVYRRLYVSLVSASYKFVEWMQRRILDAINAGGSIDVRRAPGRNPFWRLRYAKAESLALLRWMYHEPDILCLRRKRAIALPFLRPPVTGGPRRAGRPMVR